MKSTQFVRAIFIVHILLWKRFVLKRSKDKCSSAQNTIQKSRATNIILALLVSSSRV